MKKTNRKSRLTLTALGIAFSTAVAYTSAHAEYDTDYEMSSIYDAAVNDIPYSSPASIRAGGYKSEILLDESYHEYQTGEVDAF